MTSMYRVLIFCLSALSAHAGILVLNSEAGLQFPEAASISFNGKDKALSLGQQPRIAGPINKLPSLKISGTILKHGDSNVLAIYSEGAPQFFIPEGLPKTATPDPAAIWRDSHIAYKKTEKDKTPTEVPAAQFVAFLPDGVEELAHLCADAPTLEFIGGKSKSFATQLLFTAAAAKSFGNDPAMAPLERSVRDAMRTRLDEFNSGTRGAEALDEGLQFTKLSEAAYQSSAEQKQLRDQLRSQRAWLDRKKAILRAFLAAGEWDAYLIADHDADRYRAAFLDLAPMRVQALNQSLAMHRAAGEERNKEQEYGAAWREFRLASMRKPSDSVLRQSARAAWANYSNQIAKDHQGARKQLTPGERSAIAQDLQQARNYLQTANKPERALEQLTDAEHIDPLNLDVFLLKAEVMGKLRDFQNALAILDEYDKRAVDEERTKSEALRANFEFQRDNALDDLKTQIRKTYDAMNFHQARDLATQALKANPDEPEMLNYSARLSLILRDPKAARETLRHYLDVTTNLDVKDDERESVRQMLAAIRDSSGAANGTPNWLSGGKLPAGAFYDPASGAFQPKIDRIAASNKLTTSFEWEGDRLKSIIPTFEKGVAVTAEQRIYFAYDGLASPVASAGRVPDGRSPSTDPDELFRRTKVRLANNPYADPIAIQRLTKKNLAIGVAGNSFFDPFVWDDAHFFQLTYDDRGYLKMAREIGEPGAAAGDRWVEFDWDGRNLAAIRGYRGPDAGHGAKIYQRTMRYEGDRLISEEIEFQGKSGKVKYNYNGGRLASATADRSGSLDDRSRQVTFR